MVHRKTDLMKYFENVLILLMLDVFAMSVSQITF